MAQARYKGVLGLRVKREGGTNQLRTTQHLVDALGTETSITLGTEPSGVEIEEIIDRGSSTG